MEHRTLLAICTGVILFGYFAPLQSTEDEIQLLELSEANCSYFGEALPESIQSFKSNRGAETMITEILDTVGLAKNFTVRAGGVPNAAAMIKDSMRYILYNPSFVHEMEQLTRGNKWAARGIMAHEIGHHLQGHTLTKEGSRPHIELQADEFSGDVLAKMGATMEDALVAMNALAPEQGSATHPGKRDRLAAISTGWEQGCENIETMGGKCAGKRYAAEPKPSPKPDCREPRYYDGEKCRHPRDDCGEEEVWSSSEGCHYPTPEPAPDPIVNPASPTPLPSQIPGWGCCNQYGRCNLPVPGPLGMPCYCNDPMGGRWPGQICP